MQEWFAYSAVEIVDQRPHEKGCQDRAYSDEGEDFGNFTSAKQKQDHTQNDAGEICCNADIFEFADFPLICHDQSDSIIGGYT